MHGYVDASEMDANLYRISYEVDNDVQWGNDALGNPPPYDFLGFTRSTDTPYNLAINFLRYYERPTEYNQPIRRNTSTILVRIFAKYISRAPNTANAYTNKI